MDNEKLLLLTGDYAEDYEVMVPFQALKMVGYEVDAASPGKGAGDHIHTAIHYVEDADTYREREGHPFQLNADFEALQPDEYAGLVLPGGRAPEYIRLNVRLREMVREFFASNKPVAAICHAAQILVASDVVDNRTLTGYEFLRPDVELAGGTWSEENPTVDDNLVTAQAWANHPTWLSAFLKRLGHVEDAQWLWP